MRKVRYTNGRLAVSWTPNTVFAPDAIIWKPGRNILDIAPYCDDYELTPMTGLDAELTRALRAQCPRLKRSFAIEQLFQKPMLTMEDGTALLLPLDNELGVDYLTYRSEIYQKFICELSDLLVQEFPNDVDVKNCALNLLIDYSANNPYSSTIRHDGKLLVSDSVWSKDNLSSFARIIDDFLRRNFTNAFNHLEEYCPSMNPTKSTGFNDKWPNGERFIKKDHCFFVPERYKGIEGKANEWVMYNNQSFKQAWIDSGIVLDNLRWQLANCKRWRTPEVLIEAFERQALCVHKEAYRINNADLPIMSASFKLPSDVVKRGGHAKDREGSVEVQPYIYGGGTINNERYEKDLRALNPGLRLVKNKKRPMYPAPNAVFSPPFILLFRMLLKDVEDSCYGFPSLNKRSMSHLNHVYQLKDNFQTFGILSFDRKTSEQFITDNFSRVEMMMPGWLQDIARIVTTSVLPSKYGPRVVAGCLMSGTAPTTFLNGFVGFFEMANVITALCLLFDQKISFETILKRLLNVIFDGAEDGSSYISVNENLAFSTQMGTDDQLLFIHTNYVSTNNELYQLIDNKLASFFKERSLGYELGECTIFGLRFLHDRFNESKALGLGKLFLSEKVKNGDRTAFKYYTRLTLLNEYRDIVSFLFKKYGFGSIDTYKKGSDNFWSFMMATGYPISEEFNVHSPVDKIVMSKVFSTYGVDPLFGSKKYTEDRMRPFAEEFRKFIFTHC